MSELIKSQQLKNKRLENQIREMINRGEGIDENGRFLSERKLSERFGVSRTTVRNAIRSLCSQGQLVQVHGKGTFIINIQDPRYQQSLYSITECAQYYREQGLTPFIKVLSVGVENATNIVASYLRVQKGDPVLRVKKLFKANRMIMNVTISYISLSSFPNANTANFTEPVVEVLRSLYGAVPRKTENTIEAILPPSEIAHDLQISESTPILLFESVTSGIMNGRFLPLEYYKTYHRTDKLRFNFEQEHEAVKN